MAEGAVESSEKVMVELIQVNWLAAAFIILLAIVLAFIVMMWKHSSRRDDITVEIMGKMIQTSTLLTAKVDELVRRCHNKIGGEPDEGGNH